MSDIVCVASDQQIKEMNTLVDSSVKGLPKNPIQRNQSCFSEAGVRRIPQYRVRIHMSPRQDLRIPRSHSCGIHRTVEPKSHSQVVSQSGDPFEGIESRKRNCFSLMAGTHLDTQYSLLPHSDKWIGVVFGSSVFFGTNVSLLSNSGNRRSRGVG